jgi:hypothetical protein
MSFCTTKIFESKSSASKGTIFFVGPYTGKEVYFKPFLSTMSAKFRVVYIQPKDSVLDYRKPENLAVAISEVGEFIKIHIQKPSSLTKKVKSKLEGLSENYFVGVSLGAYFGYNLLPTLKKIDTYYFNAAGAFVSHLVENAEFKKLLNTSVFTTDEMEHAHALWSAFEVERLHGIKLRGKNIKIVNSSNDKLVQKKHTKELFELADIRGANMQFEYTNFPGHQSQTLAINLYAKKIERFIKQSELRNVRKA